MIKHILILPLTLFVCVFVLVLTALIIFLGLPLGVLLYANKKAILMVEALENYRVPNQ